MTLDIALKLIEAALAVAPTTAWADRVKLVDAVRVLHAALAERQVLLDSRPTPSGAAQPTSTPPAS